MLKSAICRQVTFLVLTFYCIGIVAVGSHLANAQGFPSGTPSAENDVHFSIRPAGVDGATFFQDVEVQPGETISLEAEVVNWAPDPVSLRLYKTNAWNAANGGYLAGDYGEDLVGSAVWIDIATQDIELSSVSSQVISFTVSVPEETEPGQYISSLVAETVDSMPVPGEENLTHRIRYSMSVGILVPGEMVPAFEIGEAVVIEENFEVTIINTGNILVRPAGSMEIKNSSGDVVISSPIEMKAVYAGVSTHISLWFPVTLQEDNYTLTLTLVDPESSAEAAIENLPLKVIESEVPSSLEVTSITIEPNADDIDFASIELSVQNHGEQFPVTIELSLFRDGKLVDTYLLATNQLLTEGETLFSARYIPPDSWDPGAYTFGLVILGVDPRTGQEMVIDELELDSEIVVP